MRYTYADLVEGYRAVGVEAGRVVYVTADLGRLMGFEKPGKQAICEAHLGALQEILGPEGTLVVSTASLNLCNTDIPFDPATTPTHYSGVLSEHVLKQPGARRSFHPFRSYTALGARAAEIADDVSRHAYGPDTPESRMVDMDALCVSVGLYPRYTCSTVHHCEHTMAVPYRYTKEFIHPVVRNGEVVREPFFLFVWYRNSDVKRSLCKTIMEDFEATCGLARVDVGRGPIYAYPIRDFFENTIRLMKKDPYVWCEFPPTIRPWRE